MRSTALSPDGFLLIRRTSVFGTVGLGFLAFASILCFFDLTPAFVQIPPISSKYTGVSLLFYGCLVLAMVCTLLSSLLRIRSVYPSLTLKSSRLTIGVLTALYFVAIVGLGVVSETLQNRGSLIAATLFCILSLFVVERDLIGRILVKEGKEFEVCRKTLKTIKRPRKFELWLYLLVVLTVLPEIFSKL